MLLERSKIMTTSAGLAINDTESEMTVTIDDRNIICRRWNSDHAHF